MSLVLTRRPGESVMIGADVRVTITHINGSQVRLLFEAPDNVQIDRSEIRARKLADPYYHNR